MSIDLTNVLPPLHARWMAELLPGPLQDECKTTCNDCALLRQPGVKVTYREKGQTPLFEEYQFNPVIKCCTITPKLPNFLVGAALGDPTLPEAGRESLRRRMASRRAVTPFGLWHVVATEDTYWKRVTSGFGQDSSLACPHFVEGNYNCSIWKHRIGVCAAYFCRPVRGLDGANFWWSGFRALSRTVETELAQWAASEVGLPESSFLTLYEFRKQTAPWSDLCDDGGEPDEAAYAAGWGPWAGREEDFYKACAEKVTPLSWKQVEEICGARTKVLAALTVSAYRAMQVKEIPRRLRVNWRQFLWVGGVDGAPDRYLSYDQNDYVELPRVLSLGLMEFQDGEETEIAVQRARAKGAVFTPEILQELLTHRILVEC